MSTATWGASCAASRATRAPYVLARVTTSSSGHSSPVTFEAPATTTSRGPAGAAASASRSSASASATLPGTGRRTVRRGFQGSSAAWCSDSKTNVVVSRGQAAAEEVERVGGVAGEDDQVLLAGADERADLGAGLLVPARGDPGGVAVAAVDRGVGAQGDIDCRLDRLQRRGAGGVVEVGVVHDRAVQRRHAQVLRHRAGGRGERSGVQRRYGAQVVTRRRVTTCGRGRRRDGGGGVAVRLVAQRGDRHRGGAPRRSWRTNGSTGGCRDLVVRACRSPSGGWPGRHPEHPTAEEGCRPASRG